MNSIDYIVIVGTFCEICDAGIKKALVLKKFSWSGSFDCDKLLRPSRVLLIFEAFAGKWPKSISSRCIVPEQRKYD